MKSLSIHALFPGMNCYAIADGLPAWMNLVLAIADEVNANLDEERAKADPRLKAYTGKYDEMLEKYKKERPNRQTHRGA